MDARSQHDYIALSRLFHTVMLFDVPVMTAQLESEARRFIALVDEFYERHVKLVVSAAVPLYDIYQGERLKFEFQRCLSSAGDAERRVPQTSAYALTGDFFRRIQGPQGRPRRGLKNLIKGSIFDPDFSIILRPHVTRRFFPKLSMRRHRLFEGVGLLDNVV